MKFLVMYISLDDYKKLLAEFKQNKWFTVFNPGGYSGIETGRIEEFVIDEAPNSRFLRIKLNDDNNPVEKDFIVFLSKRGIAMQTTEAGNSLTEDQKPPPGITFSQMKMALS